MKILVNASTCTIGGGAQVAANLIIHAIDDARHEFRFVVSQAVARHIVSLATRDDVTITARSPAHPIRGRNTRNILREIEGSWCPDVVFTVFGPSYVTFKVPHVCGYARGWDTHPNELAIATLSVGGRAKRVLLSWVRAQSLRNADYVWVESETAKKGVCRICGVSESRVTVIPNCYASVYDDIPKHGQQSRNEKFVVLAIGSPYPQKRFPFVAEVAAELRERGLGEQIRFVVTLPGDCGESRRFWGVAKRKGVTHMFKNVGVLNLAGCVEAYQRCDMVFLPTVLETFSVSHLEAMRMGRPIVTSDFEFTRDVCEDAAEYFDPSSVGGAAGAIEDLYRNPTRNAELVEYGHKRVEHFPSPREKYERHIQHLEAVVNTCQTSG